MFSQTGRDLHLSSQQSHQNKNIRFPEKIRNLIDSTNDIVTWNNNGTSIFIDMDALDGYLLSGQSIFSTKSLSNFVQQLQRYGFKRISRASSKLAKVPFIAEFRHPNFREDRPQSIDKIIRHTGTAAKSLNSIVHFNSNNKNDLHSKDPCKKLLKQVTNLNGSRFNFKFALRMEQLRYIIMKKIEKCCKTNDFVIELTTEQFENTVESTFDFDEDQNDLAGYYGTLSRQEINMFLGEYLPFYENESKTVDAEITPNTNTCPLTYPTKIEEPFDQYDTSFAASTLAPIAVSNFTEIHYENENEKEEINEKQIDDMLLGLSKFCPQATATTTNEQAQSDEITDMSGIEIERSENNTNFELNAERDTNIANLNLIFSEIRETIDILNE